MTPVEEIGIIPVLDGGLSISLIHQLQSVAKLGINVRKVFMNVVRELTFRMNLRPKGRVVAFKRKVRETFGLGPGNIPGEARRPSA